MDRALPTGPRLYLDVDGCVCPFVIPDPAWGDAAEAAIRIDHGGGLAITYDVCWAPALIRELDALRAEFDLDLVWLTTWNQTDAARRLLVPELGGLDGGRILPPAPLRNGETPGWWKAKRLLEDQAAAAGPFVWVDDAEIEPYGREVLTATLGTPSLLIQPDPLVGIQVEAIRAMQIWLRRLA